MRLLGSRFLGEGLRRRDALGLGADVGLFRALLGRLGGLLLALLLLPGRLLLLLLLALEKTEHGQNQPRG
ncbi:hypothetical protein BDK63_002877 [Halomonas campaniensis]|uniref:Uncharacterized protein n=1 Tax=Halomonas campaniensis TaxID=213554 RepID=A0A7W5PCF6_9GAMM|nr:hypothetical protein [Halomonas campaniensis]